MGPGSDFERELLEAMTKPLPDAGAASHLLPYIVMAPALSHQQVWPLLWDGFVNAG